MKYVKNNTKLFIKAIDRLDLNDKDLTERDKKILLMLKLLRSKCKILSYHHWDHTTEFIKQGPYLDSFVLMTRNECCNDEIKLEYKGYKFKFIRPTPGTMRNFYFLIYKEQSGIALTEQDLDAVTFSVPLFWQMFVSKKNDPELIELFKQKFLKILDDIVEYKEEEKLLNKILNK